MNNINKAAVVTLNSKGEIVLSKRKKLKINDILFNLIFKLAVKPSYQYVSNGFEEAVKIILNDLNAEDLELDSSDSSCIDRLKKAIRLGRVLSSLTNEEKRKSFSKEFERKDMLIFLNEEAKKLNEKERKRTFIRSSTILEVGNTDSTNDIKKAKEAFMLLLTDKNLEEFLLTLVSSKNLFIMSMIISLKLKFNSCEIKIVREKMKELAKNPSFESYLKGNTYYDFEKEEEMEKNDKPLECFERFDDIFENEKDFELAKFLSLSENISVFIWDARDWRTYFNISTHEIIQMMLFERKIGYIESGSSYFLLTAENLDEISQESFFTDYFKNNIKHNYLISKEKYEENFLYQEKMNLGEKGLINILNFISKENEIKKSLTNFLIHYCWETKIGDDYSFELTAAIFNSLKNLEDEEEYKRKLKNFLKQRCSKALNNVSMEDEFF